MSIWSDWKAGGMTDEQYISLSRMEEARDRAFEDAYYDRMDGEEGEDEQY